MSRKRRIFVTESNDANLNADLPGYASYDFTDNMDAFLAAVKSRNRSADTISFYRVNLLRFRDVLEEQGLSSRIDRITHDMIERNFINYSMDVRNNSYGTVAIRLRALRAFLNWMKSRGIIGKTPLEGIVISKVDSELQTYSREQLNKLFRQPDLETFVGFRDYAILTVMIETGVRLRELVDIAINDVKFTDSQIVLDGKRGGFRRVPIQRKTTQVLRRYLKVRGESPVDSLFITQDDGEMSRKAVQDRVSKYGRMAEITNVRNSPHTFRHTFAKLSVQNGANIFELQRILGHSTLDMVRTYVNLFSSDVAKAHAKFSPIENLNMPD